MAKLLKDKEEEIKFKEEIELRKKENPDAFKKTGAEKGNKTKKQLDAQKALARKREMEKMKEDQWVEEKEEKNEESKDE